jgi:hypothetical protein
MSVEELITALRALEESLKDIQLDMDDVLPSKYCNGVCGLADDVLITAKGECNWDNIEILKDAGYDVFPLERDRFGWLVAGIQTSKGIVTYG